MKASGKNGGPLAPRVESDSRSESATLIVSVRSKDLSVGARSVSEGYLQLSLTLRALKMPLQAMIVPKLRTPIILVHGVLGFDEVRFFRWTLARYFPGIVEALSAHGNRVLVAAPEPDPRCRGAGRSAEAVHQLPLLRRPGPHPGPQHGRPRCPLHDQPSGDGPTRAVVDEHRHAAPGQSLRRLGHPPAGTSGPAGFRSLRSAGTGFLRSDHRQLPALQRRGARRAERALFLRRRPA